MNEAKLRGLTDDEVLQSRKTHGSNALELEEDRVFWNTLKGVVTEPMFLLLVAACTIYFITGSFKEGIIMAVSLFAVAGISLFQEWRSRTAIAALHKLSSARARIIRNDIKEYVLADDVVVGDVMAVEEGDLIAADAKLLEARDLSVNESMLTGESFAVFKSPTDNNLLYRGTLVTSGNGLALVTAVGRSTVFGGIGRSVMEQAEVRTPLQDQVSSFVKTMVWIGGVAFLVVVGFNWYRSHDLLQSFLQGLTLAMSILPEEIPVAFSTFQALGAFRLLRQQVIVKQPQQVEVLGAATVICADKTGTLTQNRMRIAAWYDLVSGHSTLAAEDSIPPLELISHAMWSSETDPFDPMERAIHALYGKSVQRDVRKEYEQIHEYPIGGTPPRMTHIFRNAEGHTIIAVKGAPEGILAQSRLDENERSAITSVARSFAEKGFRVLGVGHAEWLEDKWPAAQEEFTYSFIGLIAFEDPPKENMKETILRLRDAGIRLKMITGDHPGTARAIASSIGLDHGTDCLTGEQVRLMEHEDLKKAVRETAVFARMFPEAKLRVIEALKDDGEVVAMTGDGVNDAPALKAAHIGIAMGKRGSEVAKGAAALILADDDLTHMVGAIALGRKISENLRKAVRYIVSIHIPIIGIVTFPLLLQWSFTSIFTPVHVIFLELVMGPTCSIIYENEPMEPGTMSKPPRPLGTGFLSLKQLSTSIIQGLVITAACLAMGWWALRSGQSQENVRTVIFLTLLFSNMSLTFVNRSFRESIFHTIRYRNWMVVAITFVNIAFILALLLLPWLRDLFSLATPGPKTALYCVAAALAGTLWLEFFKGKLKN